MTAGVGEGDGVGDGDEGDAGINVLIMKFVCVGEPLTFIAYAPTPVTVWVFWPEFGAYQISSSVQVSLAGPTTHESAPYGYS